VRPRRKPYTQAGIGRVPCKRCGRPSVHQWFACATNSWYGVCLRCDIMLNRVVLQFFRFGDWRRRLVAYTRREFAR
jgi:hypothetical protein